MDCQINEPINTSINWITTAKDIAIVVLSGTAILFGYIQHRRLIRAEWTKGLRIEIAKLISTASRIHVSEVVFRKESTESIGLITLYLSDEDKLQNKLMTQIKALETLWLDHRNGQRRDEDILEFVNNVNQSAKAVFKAEQKKIF